MSDLLDGRVISTAPQKCETCENDAKEANCVKLILAGGQHICMEKDIPAKGRPDSEASKQCGTMTCGYRSICKQETIERCPCRTTPSNNQ